MSELVEEVSAGEHLIAASRRLNPELWAKVDAIADCPTK